MIKQRNIAMCIILSIVTCGIYGLYWLVCITDDMNTATEEQWTTGSMVLLFSIVTCGIYSIYWAYKMGEKVDILKAKSGTPTSNSGLLYLILSLFGFGIVVWALVIEPGSRYIIAVYKAVSMGLPFFHHKYYIKIVGSRRKRWKK